MKSRESSTASLQLKRYPTTTTLLQVAAALLSSSLADYRREAWPLVEKEEFIGSWYWECLCEYLEAITYGQIRRLTIACPPRFGKSSLVSVLWPT
jgi:hypothetical protein